MDTQKLLKYGIKLPEILLPREDINYSKWAVVACDQYTSNQQYWEKVKEITNENPSTYNLVLPEFFLNASDVEERIKNINLKMKKYLDEKIFRTFKNGIMYVERTTKHSGTRKGVVVALDLERYDYNKGSKSLIRATEGTILDRLPPRIKIRKDALIELPHIMVLVDDPGMALIEPLSQYANKSEIKPVYDFDLMQNGGKIKGFYLKDSKLIDGFIDAIEQLSNVDEFNRKYNLKGVEDVLLFAMGDGNHSFATAKAIWEDIKVNLSEEERESHPARFALVEIVNVHDSGLNFEPIHRVLFNTRENFENEMINYFQTKGIDFLIEEIHNEISTKYQEYMSSNIDEISNKFIFLSLKGNKIYTINDKDNVLTVGSIQIFLDQYLKNVTDSKIDYIHGFEEVKSLVNENNVGLIMPPMKKSDLFKTVILNGALPRKTFSMGEADEKRFYLEARMIKYNA